MSIDYTQLHKQLVDNANQITEKRAAWMERILFLSVTLFGILVSLYSGSQTTQYTRLCFAVACILLALGILLLGVASYQHIASQVKAMDMFAQEIQNAIEEDRAVRAVHVRKSKIFSVCEKIAYICLLTSVLLLAVYVSLLDLLAV